MDLILCYCVKQTLVTCFQSFVYFTGDLLCTTKFKCHIYSNSDAEYYAIKIKVGQTCLHKALKRETLPTRLYISS